MTPSLGSVWAATFPPKPTFTEKDVPDLSGKIYLVTGANSGLGKELSRMLYSKNGKVYVTARSAAKADEAIRDIKATAPDSKGALVPLVLDLTDLSTIKASAEKFMAVESRLHCLFNNAGYMGPEKIVERTPQGHEMHFGVNCLGPFLLTKLLTPTLVATAQDKVTPPNSVRVIFLTSFAADLFAEKDTIVDMANLDFHADKDAKYRYGASKAGDWIYSYELSRRYKTHGIIGLGVNPGNLKSSLFRHQSSIFRLLTGPVNYPVINGAYSELWAGLSPEVTLEKAGGLINPFGRFGHVRRDWEKALKPEAEGGNGTAEKFWEWSEAKVTQYA
ncbi:short-chain alcohol dehydrogenase [Conoideocrella luteorostrata]|uniref:Short-chain alcohol dehydrogenase n=1 Tax=Conoideocrella luteorostrata TaxID=1105319 RepID=A0AAJ0CVV8_9HYPO|nr:short-chain alcohol dehydrogenase [Conoideocrella luteorostrata]